RAPAWAASLAMVAAACALALAEGPGRRTESFSKDPGWEGYRNRLFPSPAPRTRQDFGHRATRHARGEKTGEAGGWIQRSTTPAWYARRIAPRTLSDKLAASGKLAVTSAEGASGALVGWFDHETSRGWRTPSSLAFRIDGNGGKYWVLFEYGTRSWRTGGGATFEGRYQTTSTKPFLADGTSREWSLRYDPEGAGGQGEIVFAIDGADHKAVLEPGHKADGASFDRFGLFNQQISGSGLELYMDDLVLDGEREGFDADPLWESRGSRASHEERVVRPFHDLGWSPSRHAGGEGGETARPAASCGGTRRPRGTRRRSGRWASRTSSTRPGGSSWRARRRTAPCTSAGSTARGGRARRRRGARSLR
ncbi:MAG: hypothetical protein HY721_34745, partial [Planctomycetes bacterium]|nr:hypothetical protein [Planctomycetota bacterium]